MVNECKNVTVIPLGNQVPIPRSLFAKLDVVIAGASSAIFSSYEGTPVIVANAESDKTAGCLYYETNDAWYAEPKYSYAEMLEKVLINREYDNRQPNLPDGKPSDWHHEQVLKIQRDSSLPALEYFTEKFKQDHRKFWSAVFPFDNVLPHSKIVLYGMNDVTVDYLNQLNNYCQVVGIVADDYEKFDRTILPPKELKNLSYDGIVIADFPNQQRIDKIRENILKITGRLDNVLYRWLYLDNS